MTIASHGFRRYRPTNDDGNIRRNSQLALLRQYICRQLPQLPRLNDTAKALNVSSRSLQRFLQGHNTSFRQLVNECRHQLARQYLQENTYNIQQIATQLGFEEQSSFQKAFKSWQGCPPGVYRQRSSTTISRSYPGQPLASRQVMYGTN
ncbi:AraC family transcriptional regulator [Arsukibacterium sp.]|uniref:helix-turn-helix domain-containing protein n=1 Tax=Arsukibacterium sp. TaxID=1977258 RepID=UPI001BD2135A|nr:AraC family transcriptional regulator [Arsukibacterium sp.]